MNTTLDMVGRTNSKPKPDNTISSIANVTQNFFSIRADSRNERNNELRQTGKFNYLLAQEDKMRNKTNNAPNISSDRSHPSGNQSKSLYRHNLRLQRQMLTQQKIESLRQEKREHETKDCTFKPKTNTAGQYSGVRSKYSVCQYMSPPNRSCASGIETR